MSEEEHDGEGRVQDNRGGARRLMTVRSQILISVNVVLAIVTVVFLALDYQRVVSERLEDKRISLAEEARNLTVTIPGLCGTDEETIQAHIDQMCGHVTDHDSPGHHIVAYVQGKTYQSRAHHRASHGMLAAIEAAAASVTGEGNVDGEHLLVGTEMRDGVKVHVSEYLSGLTREVRLRFAWRVLAVLALAGLAAVLASLVVLRVVARPLDALVDAVDTVASGDLTRRAEIPRSREMACLAHAFNRMSAALQTSEGLRLEEMARARAIQEHLLPTGSQVPGLVIATLYEPAATVSGDYYDVLPLPDGSWLMCVADVTGHGVPAALGVAMLKMLLLEAVERHKAPGEILEFIDGRYSRIELPAMFATMALIRWSSETGMQYASAGHVPLLQLRPGEMPREHLPSRPLIGVGWSRPPMSQHIDVASGDRFFLLTDGLEEAADQRGEMFGAGRVTTSLLAGAELGLGQAVARLAASVSEFCSGELRADDATVFAFEIEPSSAIGNASGAVQG